MSLPPSRPAIFCGAKIVFLALVAVAAFLIQIAPALAETTGSLNGLEYSEGSQSVIITRISRETQGAVDIPATINGKPVTGIGDYAFYQCAGINRISIPEGVRDIGLLAFAECAGLKQVKLPAGLEKLGAAAFAGCLKLSEIEIPASLRHYRGAFSGCTRLKEIRVHGGNRNFKSVDGVVFNAKGTRLVEFPAGREGSYGIPHDVTMIGESAFAGGLLSGVKMPETVAKTGTMVFNGCAGLKSVRISPRLKILESQVLGQCTSLKAIEIPHGVTEIGHSAFEGCENLERVSIPGSVKVIANNAFWFCGSLRRISLPDDLAYLGGGAFSNSGLVSVTIPKGIRKLDSAFIGCADLEKVNLPSSLIEIETLAFYECVNLKSIVIPKKVRFVGDDAFRHCWKLRDVRFEGNAPQLGRAVFGNGKKLTIARYADASGFSGKKWKRFKQVKIP
jgi:hypothetical protein